MNNYKIAVALGLLLGDISAQGGDPEVPAKESPQGLSMFDSPQSLYQQLLQNPAGELRIEELKLGYGHGYPDSTGSYR